MKILLKYLLLFQALLFSSQISAQEYVVIHVKGIIKLASNNKTLTRGQKISPDEILKFGDSKSIAAVLDPDKGRFILKPKQENSNSNDLEYALKSIIKPMRGRMSTRSGGINNALDFKKFFGKEFAFVGDRLAINVSSSAYPMNEKNFFYIQYRYMDELVNKKLSNDKDTLIIIKNELLSIDGLPINPQTPEEYRLFYYNSLNQKSSFLCPINFKYLELNFLKEIVSIIKTNKAEDIYIFLDELYDRCQLMGIELALAQLSSEKK